MRVAVAADGDMVAAHFGRCQAYAIADIDDGRVGARSEVQCPHHEPGLVPKILREREVDCVVAGGIGRRAQALFAQFGIRVIPGVAGTIEDVLTTLADGALEAGESMCDRGTQGHPPCREH